MIILHQAYSTGATIEQHDVITAYSSNFGNPNLRSMQTVVNDLGLPDFTDKFAHISPKIRLQNLLRYIGIYAITRHVIMRANLPHFSRRVRGFAK